jgi:hypothetical protein
MTWQTIIGNKELSRKTCVANHPEAFLKLIVPTLVGSHEFHYNVHL